MKSLGHWGIAWQQVLVEIPAPAKGFSEPSQAGVAQAQHPSSDQAAEDNRKEACSSEIVGFSD